MLILTFQGMYSVTDTRSLIFLLKGFRHVEKTWSTDLLTKVGQILSNICEIWYF